MQRANDAIPLSDLERDASASIIGFSEAGQELSNRLLELGFIHGSVITANGKAPFGNPLIFTIHGGRLALRKEDAQNILVRKI